MLFCTEDIVDGRPASTLLIYFSGIFGFSADCKGYLPARSYISYLVGLVYVQRLLFLEYVIPAREYPLFGISPRPRVGQVARLQKIHQKYIVLGSQSPFEEMFSLMAYSREVSSLDTLVFLL
jgi:hypothetical protein